MQGFINLNCHSSAQECPASLPIRIHIHLYNLAGQTHGYNLVGQTHGMTSPLLTHPSEGQVQNPHPNLHLIEDNLRRTKLLIIFVLG